MSSLEGYLSTIGPDLQNMTRLFGVPDSIWDGHVLSYDAAEEQGCFVCRFRDEAREAVLSVPVPQMQGDARLDELHRKRALRRLCRQTLYELMKKRTGIHPPWGSMTGIRPTRLMVEALERGLSFGEAEADLISAFDLLPEKASLLTRVVRFQQGMLQPDDGIVDIYIGIPFCTTRCAYCTFSSGELGNGKLVEPYLQALIHEMEQGRDVIRSCGRKVRAVYMGGGTPTALTAPQLARVLDHAVQLFPGAMEWTVEAGRPDTIDREKLCVIRDRGVKRISINPQTMNDRTLRIIGRNHTGEDVVRAYETAREVGFSHINMDVIAGLPGEGTEDFGRTMDWAVKLHPESLTVHTLAIKRTSRMQMEGAVLPDAGTAAEMVAMGEKTAAGLHMEPYYLYRQKQMAGNQENVGYAIEGHGCQYNVDIMEEQSHILAFGAGGISKRVFPEEGHIERAPNVANIETYIERWEEMALRKRELFEKP